MDNLEAKDTILLVDDEPIVLDVGALMVKKLDIMIETKKESSR